MSQHTGRDHLQLAFFGSVATGIGTIAQQVNQLVTSQDYQQNKLGDSYAPPVDISAETETKRIDRDLATLEKVHRGREAN